MRGKKREGKRRDNDDDEQRKERKKNSPRKAPLLPLRKIERCRLFSPFFVLSGIFSFQEFARIFDFVKDKIKKRKKNTSKKRALSLRSHKKNKTKKTKKKTSLFLLQFTSFFLPSNSFSVSSHFIETSARNVSTNESAIMQPTIVARAGRGGGGGGPGGRGAPGGGRGAGRAGPMPRPLPRKLPDSGYFSEVADPKGALFDYRSIEEEKERKRKACFFFSISKAMPSMSSFVFLSRSSISTSTQKNDLN